MSEDKKNSQIDYRKPLNRKTIVIVIASLAVVLVTVGLIFGLFLPMHYYSNGDNAFAAGNYKEAYNCFLSANSYKDSATRAAISLKGVYYNDGMLALSEYRFEDARAALLLADDFLDAREQYAIIDKAEAYHNAEVAHDTGDYETSREGYEGLGDYLDSEYRYIVCTYDYADALFDEGRYYDAAALYRQIRDYEDSSEKMVLCAEMLFQNEDYEEASRTFSFIGNMDYYNYCKGMVSFLEGNYSESRSYFILAHGVEDSEEYINIDLFYEAEEDYAEGNLDDALEKYSMLPEDYELNEVVIQDRLEILQRFHFYVDICGTYISNDNVIRTRENYGYGWHEWYREDIYGGRLDIRVIIHDDLSVTVIGCAKYKIFTNYSISNYLLNVADRESNFSIDIPYNGSVPTMPRTINGSGDTSITFSNGVFRLQKTVADGIDAYIADFTYDEHRIY